MRSQEQTWKLVATLSAIGMGLVFRSALRGGWKRVTRREPPDQPGVDGASWREALIWSAASGVAVGLARMMARRSASVGWKKVTGRAPPRVRV